MSKSGEHLEFEARRVLAKTIEKALPCERDGCHYYEYYNTMGTPENACDNMNCPWRPFLIAYESTLKERITKWDNNGPRD